MPGLLAALSLLVGAQTSADELRPLVPQTVGDRIRYETDRATVFFEAGQLTPAEMERFVRLIERGIVGIESYLADGSPASSPDPRKITYRIASDIPMSSSYRRTVLLPAERVKTDSAPYLHETTHVLLRARSDCMWLSEGFASFVQSYVAEHEGGYDGYVFSWGGNANVDRMALRYLARDAGKSVLPYVGGQGSPPEVWEERRQVAAPFYVLSHSFVKHLVERAGLATVRELMRAEDVPAALERATKRNLGQWKAEWLASLEQARAS